MASKRMNTYIVNVRFPLPDGTMLLRKIAENALTSESAISKVNKWYQSKTHEIVSVGRIEYND
jgi:hypothetical protein